MQFFVITLTLHLINILMHFQDRGGEDEKGDGAIDSQKIYGGTGKRRSSSFATFYPSVYK